MSVRRVRMVVPLSKRLGRRAIPVLIRPDRRAIPVLNKPERRAIPLVIGYIPMIGVVPLTVVPELVNPFEGMVVGEEDVGIVTVTFCIGALRKIG